MSSRDSQYERTIERCRSILDDDTDWVAAMATVACELHHAFDRYDWTGFYRRTGEAMLTVGPYQGTHGCLYIPFDDGICGACARTRDTQLVEDVTERDDHIACSSTTQSEIVVPITDPEATLVAVLDVDSDRPAAFDERDQHHLESLCRWLGEQFHG